MIYVLMTLAMARATNYGTDRMTAPRVYSGHALRALDHQHTLGVIPVSEGGALLVISGGGGGG